MEMIKCPDCGSQNIKIIENEVTCGKCGLVLEESYFSGHKIV